MLTSVEKMLFLILATLALGATYAGFRDMWLTVNRGQGELHLDKLPQRLMRALWVYIAQPTTLKFRRTTSLIHLGVVWGFTFYFLVNLGDILEGFLPEYRFLGSDNLFSSLYRFGGDILSVVVLAGVAYFILRRFVLPSRKELTFHSNVLLHPKVCAKTR
jgi:hypothetical protein